MFFMLQKNYGSFSNVLQNYFLFQGILFNNQTASYAFTEIFIKTISWNKYLISQKGILRTFAYSAAIYELQNLLLYASF